MKKPGKKWIERMANAGSLPEDASDQRLRKAVLVFLASIYCIAGIIWGISYFALRLPLSGIIPLAYSFISGLSLFYFFWTKRYGVFRFSQLSLILLLPFLLQYSLGGFAASSTVMIWSILSPVGALMFAGTTRALPWFLAYLVLMVLFGLLDPKLAQDPASIPSVFKVVFFIMNLGGVSTIFYVLLRYFVRERELAMAVLDKEHRRVVEEKDRLDKIKRVMANFVPETAKIIIEKDPEKGALDKYVKDATVLFLDIEGFTALLQKYSTERINHVIESYFSIFYDLIQKNGGDVNEMAGDGMMVIFLEPDPIKRAKSAVRAALEIQEQCKKYLEERDSFLFPIQVNIGICSGEVYLGSTKMKGTGGDRWTFTASGPVTIVAARLSDYAQGGQILIGEETVRSLEDDFALKHLGKVQLKNFKEPFEVSQVTAQNLSSPSPFPA
ncbi:MAG: adenylate/guanylate cyclase domain-containing protein [Desulfobacteraceae bacterium]|jgi:class 3 adenylate cyclase